MNIKYIIQYMMFKCSIIASANNIDNIKFICK
jgi:hypothetical protein